MSSGGMGEGEGVGVGPILFGGEGLNYWDFFSAVSDAMGVGIMPRTGEDVVRVRSICQSAYDRFLSPDPLDGVSHRWSFVTPTVALDLKAGQWVRDLPPDFGGLACSYAYFDPMVRREPIRVTSQAQVEARRGTMQEASWPVLMAVRPKRKNVAKGQQYEAIFWPGPRQDMAVSLRYRVLVSPLWLPKCKGRGFIQTGEVHPEEDEEDTFFLSDGSADFTRENISEGDVCAILSGYELVEGIFRVRKVTSATRLHLWEDDRLKQSDSDYVRYEVLADPIWMLGGRNHSETILQSGLALVESRYDETIDTQNADYMRRLATSVSKDRDMAPNNLGQMVDGGPAVGPYSRIDGFVTYGE